MEQYISKSAVVAEIESKRKYAQNLGDNAINSSMQQFYDGMKQGCVDILSFIDTLEVKEVDLEKELVGYFNDNFIQRNDSILLSCDTGSELSWCDYENIAKHFFELGMVVNNPITASDRGMAEEIIINLKRVENDYHIDLTKQMEWLRNIVKKMMKDATEAIVQVDAGGYPYIPQIELYDYDKDVPLAKEGDKCKVVLIKED